MCLDGKQNQMLRTTDTCGTSGTQVGSCDTRYGLDPALSTVGSRDLRVQNVTFPADGGVLYTIEVGAPAYVGHSSACTAPPLSARWPFTAYTRVDEDSSALFDLIGAHKRNVAIDDPQLPFHDRVKEQHGNGYDSTNEVSWHGYVEIARDGCEVVNWAKKKNLSRPC